MADETKQGEEGAAPVAPVTPAAPETPAAPAAPEAMASVPVKLLEDLQAGLARAEQAAADAEARAAGVEELMGQSNALGEPKLREKKNFEPKFRTVKLRKYPMGGDFNNKGYVIGWTGRGAYQEVDRTGVSPVLVDYLDVFFLGNDRTEDGKLKAEKVKLLDLLNKGELVNCKIVGTKREEIKVPTNEEIHVTTWDPQHGLTDTGETVDGFFAYSDIMYTVEVPGHGSVEIGGEFVN